MKRNLLITLLATFFPILLIAQETVYPITITQRENEFYVSQMRLWKSVTQKDPQNANAWYNLYLAARYKDFPAIFRDTTYRKEVDGIIEDLGRALPNSYEYYYLKAWQNGFGNDNFDLLMKAYAIDSTRPKITEDLFTHHYRQGNWDKAEYYMQKWYKHKTMMPQLLHFGYNILACTEGDGILLTSGDNDSYPLWMLQSVKNFKPEVATINLSLLLSEKYARKIAQRFNINIDESKYALLGRNHGPETWPKMLEFIRHIAEKNPGRTIYMSPGIQKEVYDGMKDDLYLVGSVFQYCEQRFDNIATLKKNWYQNMKLDYLDHMVYDEDYLYTPKGLPETVYVYLYPAAALYNHYKASGEMQEANKMLEFGKKLSVQLGEDELYKKFMHVKDKK